MIVLSSYLLDETNNRRIEAALSAAGGAFIRAPEEREDRIALLDERIGDADVLLGGRLSQKQWDRAKKLRWIHVPWAGVNSLLALEDIRRSTIPITNASGVMSDAVADQVMGCIIMLARDLPAQLRAQERAEWLRYDVESLRRRRLRGLTLGLLGYGAIGSAVAERGRGFGMHVVALRRNTEQHPPELDRLLGTDELPLLLETSDFVVVTLPLNDETRGMLGREQFGRMKPGAFLINIARGPIIRQEELVEALQSGTLAGAALDVFEKEPLPADSPLWTMPNVIITPHTAGGYRGFQDVTTDLFLDNLDRFLHGRPLRNRIEPVRGY